MYKKLFPSLIFILAAIFIVLQLFFNEAKKFFPLPEEKCNINALTADKQVAHYLQQHQRLPDFYITKTQARRQGWIPSKGNLWQVLPGHAIGGDRFSNREGILPEDAGRSWYEADVNYRCGHRSTDRLLYSSDGLIYLTTDHYHTFQRVE